GEMLHHVLEQLERRGIGPLQILDDAHQRLAYRRALHRSQRRVEECGLLDGVGCLSARAERPVQPARSDAIENRPERSVGIAYVLAAIAPCNERFAGNRCGELRNQPRFPNAGVAFDRNETGTRIARAYERFPQERELVVTADE